MRWGAPSERTQNVLLAPLIILVSPAIAMLLIVVWLDWLDRKLRPETDWLPWFAWRPVRLDQWPTQWAWLERVERMRPIAGEGWYYRAAGDERHFRDSRHSPEGLRRNEDCGSGCAEWRGAAEERQSP